MRKTAWSNVWNENAADVPNIQNSIHQFLEKCIKFNEKKHFFDGHEECKIWHLNYDILLKQWISKTKQSIMKWLLLPNVSAYKSRNFWRFLHNIFSIWLIRGSQNVVVKITFFSPYLDSITSTFDLKNK